MKILNQIMLVGNVASVPHFSIDGRGRKFLRFSFAVERFDLVGQMRVCDFFAVSLLDALADLGCAEIGQGSRMFLSGFLANTDYGRGAGKVFRTEVVVERFWLLDFG